MNNKIIELFVGAVLLMAIFNCVINDNPFEYQGKYSSAYVFGFIEDLMVPNDIPNDAVLEYMKTDDFQFMNINPELEVVRINRNYIDNYVEYFKKKLESQGIKNKTFNFGRYHLGIGTREDSPNVNILYSYPFDNNSDVIVDAVINAEDTFYCMENMDNPEQLGIQNPLKTPKLKFESYYSFTPDGNEYHVYLYTFPGIESDARKTLENIILTRNWQLERKNTMDPALMCRNENDENVFITFIEQQGNTLINCTILKGDG